MYKEILIEQNITKHTPSYIDHFVHLKTTTHSYKKKKNNYTFFSDWFTYFIYVVLLKLLKFYSPDIRLVTINKQAKTRACS